MQDQALTSDALKCAAGDCVKDAARKAAFPEAESWHTHSL
jgi:hypothetical protein